MERQHQAFSLLMAIPSVVKVLSGLSLSPRTSCLGQVVCNVNYRASTPPPSNISTNFPCEVGSPVQTGGGYKSIFEELDASYGLNRARENGAVTISQYYRPFPSCTGSPGVILQVTSSPKGLTVASPKSWESDDSDDDSDADSQSWKLQVAAQSKDVPTSPLLLASHGSPRSLLFANSPPSPYANSPPSPRSPLFANSPRSPRSSKSPVGTSLKLSRHRNKSRSRSPYRSRSLHRSRSSSKSPRAFSSRGALRRSGMFP